MGNVGADPFRLFALSRSAPWSAMSYSPKEIEATRKTLDILWNIVLFGETYMELDKFSFDTGRMRKALLGADPEDRWLISRTQSVVKEFHEPMSRYLYHQASRVLLDFVTEDLSRVYLPLVKKRVWLDRDDPKKVMAYDVMHHTLGTVLRCLNVFTPFVAEKLYLHFLRPFDSSLPESINMTEMPEPEPGFVDSEIEKTFGILQEMRSAASYARNKKGVKLRHPVASVMLVATSPDVAERAEKLSNLLLDDLNTRRFEVIRDDAEPDFTRLSAKPNYKVLGPKFKDKMSSLVEALQEADAKKLRKELDNGSSKIRVGRKYVVIEPGDVEFEESLPDYMSSAESKVGKVYVDVSRTKELEAEGLIRDVTRRVQVMRKELDLKVEQSIELVVQFSDDESAASALTRKDYLATETRASALRMLGPAERVRWKDVKFVKEWEIDDLTLKVGITPK
jgi:isoleucyl-tRNA synthetase